MTKTITRMSSKPAAPYFVVLLVVKKDTLFDQNVKK